MSVDASATGVSAGSGPPTAGRQLKAAREAAGLSIDTVAQQLKLAPRQVKALEDDDWGRLPGRTFVRGFARNYARFVQLDPDAVLALLPSAEGAPALERPALAASRRPIGEIPAERVARPSAARWLLPLLLLVVAAAAVFYEFSRSQLHLPTFLSRDAASTSASSTPSVATPAPAPSPGTLTTTLPNPVVDVAPAATSPASNLAGSTAQAPASAAAVSSSPPTAAPGGVAPAPPNAPLVASVTPEPSPAPVADAVEAPLMLTFKATSWAEVKDAKGRVVLQMTGGAGMTQTVSALAPLELALGNAPGVDVTFRGQARDLAPYTRGSGARVSLK
jgi:cytoskeleton protein RodZ